LGEEWYVTVWEKVFCRGKCLAVYGFCKKSCGREEEGYDVNESSLHNAMTSLQKSDLGELRDIENHPNQPAPLPQLEI
jgi:hypothetical protein